MLPVQIQTFVGMSMSFMFHPLASEHQYMQLRSMIIMELGLGLQSHLKDWWSQISNLQPQIHRAYSPHHGQVAFLQTELATLARFFLCVCVCVSFQSLSVPILHNQK